MKVLSYILILVLGMLIFTNTAVFADEVADEQSTGLTDSDYVEIAKRYGLEVVNNGDLDSNIQSIAVSSEEELISLIEELEAISAANHHEEFHLSEKDLEGMDATTIVTRNCSVQLLNNLTVFNTWADIVVGYVPGSSYRWIDSVANTRVGLTGWTFGANMSNPYSFSYNQSSTAVSVKGGGDFNVYIGPPSSLTLIWSGPISCSFTYNVY